MTKRTKYVHTLDELELLVEELINTGDNQVQIKMNPLLYAEPKTYDILEKLVDLQPRNQTDVKTPRKAEEAQETQEVVSYSQDAQHTYRSIAYRIDETFEGFRVKILSPCGGEMEPWDFALSTFEDAMTHARAYIDQVANPGKAQ